MKIRRPIAGILVVALLLLLGPFAASGQQLFRQTSGSITAAQGTVELDVRGMGSMGVWLSGTWTATLVLEVSTGGGTWQLVDFYNLNTETVVASVTANGVYVSVHTAGMLLARVRASAFTSGTVSVVLTATSGAPTVMYTPFDAVQGTSAAPGHSLWAAGVGLGQGGTLFNSGILTSAVNTAVTQTITASAGQRGHVYYVEAICSAGSAQLSIADGGTTLWQSTATEVGTTRFRQAFSGVGWTGTTGNAMTVTLGTCGVGNTGTLIVQADRY